MNTDVIIIVVIIGSVLAISLGAILSFASVAFYVKEDPRLQELINLLPLANCGACGNPGCKGMAESILAEDAKLTSCKPGNQEMRETIAEYLKTHADEEGNFTKVKM